MKKILFILSTILSLLTVAQQKITFDKSGAITTLSITSDEFDTAIINKAINLPDSQFVKSEALLKENYKQAFELWQEDEGYKSFLISYMSKSKFEAMVKSYTISVPTSNKLLSDKLTENKTKTHRYDITKKTLYKINIFNKSLIDTYISLYESEYKKNKNLYPQTMESLRELSSHVLLCKDTLNTFKKDIKQQAISFDELYSSLYKFLNRIDPKLNKSTTAKNNEITRITNIFESSWVNEWIWIKKGKVTLNPFEFTSEDFIKYNQEYDEIKADTYNNFIEGLIKYNLNKPRNKHLEDFKKILSERNKGKDIFSYKERYDSLKIRNQRLLKVVSECEVALNQVNPEYLNNKIFTVFSAVKKTVIDGNNSLNLETPVKIGLDDEKKISVINAKQDTKLYLNVKTTPIQDKSSFQTTFDTLASELGLIASMIANFTPLNGLIETINPKSNKIVRGFKSATVSYETSSYKFEAPLTAEELLANSEKEKKTILISYFSKIVPDIDKKKLLDTINALTLLEVENKIEYIQATLETKLAQFIYNYEKLSEVFCNVTLPPTTITPTSNENAAYSTILLKVPKPQKPTENFVKIQSIKNSNLKDTTTIESFTFRAGKTYRFLLSAGLLANLQANNPRNIQTSVTKDSNGQIKVTNIAQPYSFFLALNTYLGKHGLFIQDDGLKTKYYRQRFSLVTGVGISKKPIDNLIVGFAYDLVPGLKINAVSRIFRSDDYLIQNDEIIYQKVVYQPAFSIGLSIDPVSLTKALTNVVKLKG